MASNGPRADFFGTVLLPPLVRVFGRFIARFGPRALRWGETVVVFRWHDVAEVLRQDAAFAIAPVNAARIEAVSGPFILGMDRSARLFAQREIAYGAMREAGLSGVRAVLATEPERLLDAAAAEGRAIDVVNGYARCVAARVAARFFGISGPSEPDLMRVARAVFHETFLNLGGDADIRRAGIAAGQELGGWIRAERARRATQPAEDGATDVLGALMAREQAGLLTAQAADAVLSGLLVGAIDTTATVVAQIVYEAVRVPRLRAGILADLDNPERLRGWCWEALRRRPHNPILLRQALAGTTIAGYAVPAGTRMVAVTLSAMQDPRVFDDPARLRPDRPGDRYLHFGFGLHACAGRDINALQVPRLVGALMRRAPRAASGLSMDGPFPDRFMVRLGGAA